VDALEPEIRELFAALDHAGDIPERAGARVLIGEAGLEALGTRVRFSLQVSDERLLEVRYRAYGCPHTLATCEWLARSLGSAQTRQSDCLGTASGRSGR
jgi:NifU-like protein involved in Fe-S cluster formation